MALDLARNSHVSTKNIRVVYYRVQPRLRYCKDIEVVIGNCLFKKIQIFARRHGANGKVGDGHEMFSILSCVIRGRFNVSSCNFLAVLKRPRKLRVNVATQEHDIN